MNASMAYINVCLPRVEVSAPTWTDRTRVHVDRDMLAMALRKIKLLEAVSAPAAPVSLRKSQNLGAERLTFINTRYSLEVFLIGYKVNNLPMWLRQDFGFITLGQTCEVVTWKHEAQWPIGYGVGLRIKGYSDRIRPWPLRWVLGQGSLLPSSQGEAFTLASISYLAILVKYILAKKKKSSHAFLA